MNKNIIYFIILLILPFNSNSNENFNLKFHGLNIHSMSDKHLNKIGTMRGNVDSYPYGFNYYSNIKDGKISELIETFYFDNFGDHMSRFNNWARSIVYISNPNNGCNNSENKIYHSVTDNGATQFTCFSVKIISGSDEIWSPDFSKNQHSTIPLGQRKSTLKRALKKKNYETPDKMFRVEHYFYNAGKLTWVFYSLDTELFFNDLSETNLDQFINLSIKNHQNFEKDLKYKDFMKINVE